MLRVVFDTSVYISAFVVPGSKSEEAFLLASKGRFYLFTSPAIVAETANKLKDKFGASDQEVRKTIGLIAKAAEAVKPKEIPNILSDEPDNRVLECAAEAQANLIVSGDKHLLKLKKYEETGIIRVADLLYTLKGK